MNHPVFSAALVVCCLGACAADDGHELASPGQGPANAAPLWPLRAGSRFVEEGGATFYLFPAMTLQGQRVLPYGSLAPALDRPLALPEDPWPFHYFSNDNAGNVLYHGGLRGGLFAHAALFLPATVRYGMRWEATVDDAGQRMRFEVVAREPDLPTVYGRATVWTIALRDPRNLAAQHVSNDPVGGVGFDDSAQPSPEYVVRFAEGFGPLDVDPLHGGYGTPLANALIPAVSATSAEAPLVTLRPLNGGAPVATNLLVNALTAVEDHDVLRFVAYGYAHPASLSFRYHVLSNHCGVLDAEGTFTSTGTSIQGNNYIAHCPEYPEFSTVGPDGTDVGIPGNATTCDACFSRDDPETASQCLARGCDFTAVFFGVDGRHYLTRDLALPLDTGRFGAYLVIPDAGFGSDPDAGFTVTADGDQVVATYVAADGQAHGLVHDALVGTTETVRATPDGLHDRVRTWPDGRIERLGVRAGRVDVTPLARIDLAPDHVLTGALEHDGKLLVFTNFGYRGVERAGYVDATAGDVYAWEADLTAATTAGRDPEGWGSFAVCADDADCDDGLACTSDTCDGWSCAHPTVPATCAIDGVCQPAGPDPDDPCQSCDPTTPDAWSPTAAGGACDDGLTCSRDACDGRGACVGTSTCDSDGLTCTFEACSDAGCGPPVLSPATCLIAGVCYAEGDANPGNPCEVCHDATPLAWTPRSLNETATAIGAGAALCIDRFNHCQRAGQIPGTCMVCDGATHQIASTFDVSCDDGDPCTRGDVCDQNAFCVPGACEAPPPGETCAERYRGVWTQPFNGPGPCQQCVGQPPGTPCWDYTRCIGAGDCVSILFAITTDHCDALGACIR